MNLGPDPTHTWSCEQLWIPYFPRSEEGELDAEMAYVQKGLAGSVLQRALCATMSALASLVGVGSFTMLTAPPVCKSPIPITPLNLSSFGVGLDLIACISHCSSISDRVGPN
jgi:hypothetical protein